MEVRFLSDKSLLTSTRMLKTHVDHEAAASYMRQRLSEQHYSPTSHLPCRPLGQREQRGAIAVLSEEDEERDTKERE